MHSVEKANESEYKIIRYDDIFRIDLETCVDDDLQEPCKKKKKY